MKKFMISQTPVKFSIPCHSERSEESIVLHRHDESSTDFNTTIGLIRWLTSRFFTSFRMTSERSFRMTIVRICLLLTLIIPTYYNSADAFDYHFSHRFSLRQFSDWAKKLSFERYEFKRADPKGDPRKKTYELVAGYESLNSNINIKIRDMVDFHKLHFGKNIPKPSRFDYNGFEAFTFKLSDTTFDENIYIPLPQIGALFCIEYKGEKTFRQEQATALLDSLRLKPLVDSLSRYEWPKDIPEDYRLPAKYILAILKVDPSSDDVRAEYHVIVLNDPMFEGVLEKFLGRHNGSIESTRMGDFIFMCDEAVSIKEMKAKFALYDAIDFIYYKMAGH